MKRISLLIASFLLAVPAFAASPSSSSVQAVTADKGTPPSANMNLKIALNNSSYYQMGFTDSTLIDDTLISLTEVSLVPKFSLVNARSAVELSISDESKTIRGYWLIFGSESFDLRLRLSPLVGKRLSAELAWKASWKDDDKNIVSIEGNNVPALFYSRNYAATKEIASSGSRMITFEITEPAISLEDIKIDSYSGFITMEVVAL